MAFQMTQLPSLDINHSEKIAHLNVGQLSRAFAQFSTNLTMSKPSTTLHPRCPMAWGWYCWRKSTQTMSTVPTRFVPGQFPNHYWRNYLHFHITKSQFPGGSLQSSRHLLVSLYCSHFACIFFSLYSATRMDSANSRSRNKPKNTRPSFYDCANTYLVILWR